MTNNKDQILTELTDIINESFEAKKSYKGPELGLKKSINDMITESNSNPEVMKALEDIDSALNEGKSEASLIFPLLEMNNTFAKYIPEMASIKESLENTLKENYHEITMTCLLEGMSESVRAHVEPCWNALMETGSMASRSELEKVLEPCAALDESAAKMLQYVRSYKQEEVAVPSHALNESSVSLSAEEQTKAELLNKMKEYVDNKINENNTPKAKKSYKDINNDIQLHEAIISLRHIENPNLQGMLDLYEQALNDGCREEMIYETFLQRLHEAEELNYYCDLAKVEEDMRKRAMSHKTSIDLTRVLEWMTNDATWSYLVPVVEDVVVAYAENPNAINRSVLTNHLRMYDSCPYVRDIIGVANCDNSKEGLLVRESEQFIKQRAHVEDVWSPIQYIKENECIFNVDDQFYVKKGHNLSKLNKDSMANLSESFLALAKIVNMPNVEISEAENVIRYNTEFGDTFEIHEGKVMIGDNMETPSTLKNLNEMHVRYPNCSDVNFLTGAFLCENFNNIAKVDFVKRVVMNESDDKTLDLFKVKKNIYVATHDNLNEEHTFYRNVKPMQVKNIINEHFGLEVSNLFEDLLPHQAKLSKGIKDIKNEYENKIQSLLEMKSKLNATYENTTSSETAHILEQALSDIDKEINEAKKEYMKFQKKARLVEGADPEETVDNVLDNTEASLSDTNPDDFSDVVSLNAEDYDGSDNDLDIDGSDESFSGSDFYEDIDDGSDFSELDFELDGSDYDDDYTSSDGDDMTEPIGDYESNPEIDDTDELSQRDDYNLDFHDEELDNELGNPSGDEVEAQGEAAEEQGLEAEQDLGPDAEDDPFGADTEALGADDELGMDTGTDEANVAGNEHTEEIDQDADLDYANFKIVKIDFDVNVRTGEMKNTGKAIVVVPMVDGEGNRTSDTKNIDFYVTDIQGEKGVVLDSEGITLEMYNAVCDAIKKSTDFQEVESGSKPGEDTDIEDVEIEDGTEPEEFNTDAEADIAKEDEEGIDLTDVDDESDPTDGDGATEDVFDSGSDETTVLTIDDNIEPHGVEIPEITDGDEDPQDDEYKGLFDEEPSEGDADAIPESKKPSHKQKLNESEEEEIEDPQVEQDPDGMVRADLDIAAEQKDPISVIKEVLDAYVEEGGDCVVGDINDYDVDGKEVNSIQATIGDNDYTFFTLYEDIYCAPTEDFDANSQDIDTLEDWCSLKEDEDDDAPLSANVEIAEGDTQAWVDFVTDIIATETGEDLEFSVDEPEDGEEVVEEPVDEAVKVKVSKKN